MPFFQELEVIRNDVNSRNARANFNSANGGRTSGNSTYESKTLQFPLDIGSVDKGHYLMFNVNAQQRTQFSTETTNETPTVIANMQSLQYQRGGSTNIVNENFNKAAGQAISRVAGVVNLTQNIFSSIPVVNTLINPFIGGNLGRDLTAGAVTFGEQLKDVKSSEFLRTIRRTTDTVVLYMPDKITYSNSQDYGPLSLGGDVKSLAGLSAMGSTAESKDPKNIATFAAFGLPEVLPFGKKELNALATAVTQVVKNPMLEVMYKGVKLRKFKFSFSLWPRSEKEAEEVQKIIALLRFHQAPEIKQNTGGFFLIPPSEFDISFMYNGKVNPNMDKISTCVLEEISVDYTPKGFHVFESIGSIDNPVLGRTGMPVGINLSLSFMETQIITKEYYKPYEFISAIGAYP